MTILDQLDETHRTLLENVPLDFYDMRDVQKVRRGLTAGLAAMRSATPPRDWPVATEDRKVPAAADRPEILVRIYRPVSKTAVLPALLWIHGGGMIMGDIELTDTDCKAMACASRSIFVSVNYRLAPEHPFPAALEDCYSSLEWLSANASDLGVDATRIAVGGSSAGGGLAAALCLLARDRARIRILFQYLLYPMLDDRNETASSREITDYRLWNRDSNIVAWRHYLGPDTDAAVSAYAAPARATHLHGLPAAYIAVGALDLFRDECIIYGQRLLQAGIPTDIHVYAGAIHGSDVIAPSAAVSRRWLTDRDAYLHDAFTRYRI